MSRFLFAFVSLAFGASVCGQTTLYVDDDNCPNPGTGTQADPLCRIQRAIELANGGDEIVVAPGTYNELVNFFGKAVTLRSSSGADVTTIDGTGLDSSVVSCIQREGRDTILEGFTITGGTGTSVEKGRLGGGMFVYEAGPTVIGCTFIANTADAGGGFYNYFCSTTKISHCTFRDNHVAITGGGMYNYQCSPVVTDCTFTNNSAANAGGGMRNNDSAATVRSSTFADNSAETGGGMANIGSIGPTVTDCIFRKNTTARQGGGMYNHGSSTAPTVTSVVGCQFIGNIAGNVGGGVYTDFLAHTIVMNSVFSRNEASIGGGVSGYQSYQTVTNSTFSLNVADSRGGGIDNSFGVTTVANCIIWGNSPDEIDQTDGSSSTIEYSDIQDGVPFGIRNLGGNIDSDPMFLRKPNPGAGDFGDLRLQAGSPCIDVGDPGLVAQVGVTDLAGHARILCGRVDMGAYEFGIGDHDCNQAVNLFDFTAWDKCMTGPMAGPNGGACESFAFDADDDVDLLDHAGFQRAMEF